MIPIANITALFVLFMFVYAVFGLQMFATVKHGLHLNANQNFETFPRSMLTLFQVASGENWIKMLPELGVPEAWCSVNPHAVEALKTDCGAPEVSKLLFFSFYIFVFCIFLNLYVASILDMYSSSTKSTSIGLRSASATVLSHPSRTPPRHRCSTFCTPLLSR